MISPRSWEGHTVALIGSPATPEGETCQFARFGKCGSKILSSYHSKASAAFAPAAGARACDLLRTRGGALAARDAAGAAALAGAVTSGRDSSTRG